MDYGGIVSTSRSDNPQQLIWSVWSCSILSILADAMNQVPITSSSGQRSSVPEMCHRLRLRVSPVALTSNSESRLTTRDDSFSFIGTAARACGLGATSTPRLGMLASLDHTLHFYDDTVDASDWLLFYVRPFSSLREDFNDSATIDRWKRQSFVLDEDWSRVEFTNEMERSRCRVSKRE